MKELLRTNDLVFISFVEALLKDANIEAFVMDAHTSVLEGSINAIQRRVMVGDDDAAQAQDIVKEARSEFGDGTENGD